MIKRLQIALSMIFILLFSCKENNRSEKEELTPDTNGSISIPNETNNNGEIKGLHIGCGYNYNLTTNELKIYYPQQREIEVIKNIISYSGLPLNFEIYSADIQNAVATIIDNKRYIIYDPKLLNFTDTYSNSYWSSISILAHEIGHHLSGHTLKNNINNHDVELQADKFSGFILYKMGASQEQATNAMRLIGSDSDSESHPNKKRRIQAIIDGWNEANQQRYLGAVPPPPNDSPSDFYEFNYKMLLDFETFKLNEDFYDKFYKDYKFIYGIITEVNLENKSFKIRITKLSKEFENNYGDLDILNKDWDISISSFEYGDNNEMCNACSKNFEALIVPGRRLKLAISEGCPDCGTSMNGVWFLTYAKAINNATL